MRKQDYKKAIQAILKKDGEKRSLEFTNAIDENIRPDLRTKLAPYVAAIRYAENGGKNKEYGILDKRVKPTYRSQAGWAAATIQKNYDRWVKAGSKGEYVEFLGNKYAPRGVKNDPFDKNANWIPLVTKFYKTFSGDVIPKSPLEDFLPPLDFPSFGDPKSLPEVPDLDADTVVEGTAGASRTPIQELGQKWLKEHKEYEYYPPLPVGPENQKSSRVKPFQEPEIKNPFLLGGDGDPDIIGKLIDKVIGWDPKKVDELKETNEENVRLGKPIEMLEEPSMGHQVFRDTLQHHLENGVSVDIIRNWLTDSDRISRKYKPDPEFNWDNHVTEFKEWTDKFTSKGFEESLNKSKSLEEAKARVRAAEETVNMYNLQSAYFGDEDAIDTVQKFGFNMGFALLDPINFVPAAGFVGIAGKAAGQVFTGATKGARMARLATQSAAGASEGMMWARLYSEASDPLREEPNLLLAGGLGAFLGAGIGAMGERKLPTQQRLYKGAMAELKERGRFYTDSGWVELQPRKEIMKDIWNRYTPKEKDIFATEFLRKRGVRGKDLSADISNIVRILDDELVDPNHVTVPSLAPVDLEGTAAYSAAKRAEFKVLNESIEINAPKISHEGFQGLSEMVARGDKGKKPSPKDISNAFIDPPKVSIKSKFPFDSALELSHREGKAKNKALFDEIRAKQSKENTSRSQLGKQLREIPAIFHLSIKLGKEFANLEGLGMTFSDFKYAKDLRYVRARSGAYPVKQLKDYKGKLISRKLPDDFVPIELGEGGVALGIDYQGKRLTPKEIIDLFLEESVQTLPPTLVEKLNTIKEGKIADLDLKFAGEVVPVSEVKSVMTQILRSFIEEGFDGAVIKPYKGAKVWLVFQPEKLQTLEGVRIDTISNLVDNLPTPKTALGKKVVEDIKEKFTKEHISRTVEPEDITPFNVENFLDDFIEETKLDRSLNKENPTFRVTEESLKIMESLEDLRGRLSAPIDEIFNVPPKQTLNEFLANKDNRKAINLLEKEYKLPEGTLTPEFIKKLSEGDEGITYLYAGLGDLKSLWNGVNDFIKAMKKLWQRILDMNWSLRRKMKSYLKDVSEDYGRGRSSDNFFSNWGREQVDLVPWDRPLLNKLTNWSRSRRARTQANEVGLIRVLGQWAYGSERFRIVEGKPTPAVETPAVETPAVETPAVEEKPSLETKIISSKMLIDPVFNKVTAKDLLEPDRIPRLSDEQMDKVREEIDIIERGAPKTLQEARAEVERKNFVTIKALENRISTLMSKMGELKEDHPFKLLLSKFIKKEISDNQRIITSMREKLSLMNDTLDDLKQDLLLGKINKKELDDFKEKIKSSSTRLNKLNKDLAILNDWKKFVSKGSVEALPTMELPYYNNFIRELQKEAELATANDIPLSPEIAFLQDEKYAILPTPKQEGAVTLESADLWLKEVLPRLKKDQESVYHDHLENAIKSTKQSSEFFDETGIQSKKESEHKIDFYYELKDGRFRDTKVNRQHLFDFLTTVHGNIEQSIRVFKNITPEEKVFLDTYVLSTHEYGPASIDAPPTTPDVPPTQDIIYAGAESKRGMIQHGVVRHRMRLLGDFKTKLEIREKELKKLAPKLGVNPKAFGEELSRQIFEIHQSIEVQKRKGILKELNIKEMFSDAFVKRLGITNLVLKNPKYKKEVKNFISDILADLDSLVTGAKGDIPKEVIPFVHAAPALQWDLFRDLNQLVTGKYWLSDMIADHIGFVSEGEHKVQTALKDINSPTKEVISILIESRIKKGESLKAFVIDEKQLLEILTPEQLKLLNKKLGKRYTNSDLEVKIRDEIGDSAEVYINLSETIPELILDPIKIKRHLEGARIRESNLGQKLEGNTLKNFTLLDIMRHDLFDTLDNIGTKTIDTGIQKEILNEFIEVFETISGEGSFKKEFGDKIKTVEDLFNHIESIADDLSREGTITIRKEFDLMLALLKADLTGNRPKGNLSSAVTMLQKAASANSVLGFAMPALFEASLPIIRNWPRSITKIIGGASKLSDEGKLDFLRSGGVGTDTALFKGTGSNRKSFIFDDTNNPMQISKDIDKELGPRTIKHRAGKGLNTVLDAQQKLFGIPLMGITSISQKMAFNSLVSRLLDKLSKHKGVITEANINEIFSSKITAQIGWNPQDTVQIFTAIKAALKRDGAIDKKRSGLLLIRGKVYNMENIFKDMDLSTKERFSAGLYSWVGQNIVRPDLGDLPLFLDNSFIKVLAQFRSFGIAQFSKFTGPLIQRSISKEGGPAIAMLATGMILNAVYGAMNYWIYNEDESEEDLKKWERGSPMKNKLSNAAVGGLLSPITGPAEFSFGIPLGMLGIEYGTEWYESRYDGKYGPAEELARQSAAARQALDLMDPIRKYTSGKGFSEQFTSISEFPEAFDEKFFWRLGGVYKMIKLLQAFDVKEDF